MDKKLFILGCLFLVFAYTVTPVPFCSDIPFDELTEEEPEITLSKSDISNIYSKLDEDGFLIINTFGDSMKGTIESNQRCLCVEKDNYKQGDVILFIKNGVGILHEIVYETSIGFITKGKANDFADGEIYNSQALCSVNKVPRFKLWIQSIQTFK